MANSNNSTSGSNYLECKDSDEVFLMFCEICHQKGIKNVPADGFCVNCLQYFCDNCLGFHKIFLPEHKQLDKYDMPQDFCSEFCEDHQTELVCFYCKSCDTFICRTCKTTMHQGCEILFVPDEVADFENTEDYKVYEKMIAILETDLKKIKLSLCEDYKNIYNIHQQALKTMRSQRNELLAKFDQMKMDIEDSFRKTFNNDKTRLEVLNKKLDTLSNSYRETKRQINTLKESGERCKLYMTMKQSISKLNSLTDDLEHMKEREQITKYQYKPDQSFMSSIKARKFGYTVTNQTNGSEKQKCQLVETATVKPKQANYQLSNSKETNSKEFQPKSIRNKVTAIENQPKISEKFTCMTRTGINCNEESTENNRTQDMTKDNESRMRLPTNIPKKHHSKADKQAVKEEREERNRRKEEEKEIHKQNKETNIAKFIFCFIIIIVSLYSTLPDETVYFVYLCCASFLICSLSLVFFL